MKAAKGIHITLDLTQREADELLHADLKPRRGYGGDSRWSIEGALESAQIKLQAAIDRATRG